MLNTRATDEVPSRINTLAPRHNSKPATYRANISPDSSTDSDPGAVSCMISTSQHVGKIPVTTFALASRCNPFKSRSMRNESLLWTLLMMNPLPQGRNSHYNRREQQAIRQVTCNTVRRRAITATAGRDKWGTSQHFPEIHGAETRGEWVSPAGSPTHEIQMRSAIDCPHRKDRAPSPSGHPS